jgi:hypothetical protein
MRKSNPYMRNSIIHLSNIPLRIRGALRDHTEIPAFGSNGIMQSQSHTIKYWEWCQFY